MTMPVVPRLQISSPLRPSDITLSIGTLALIDDSTYILIK